MAGVQDTLPFSQKLRAIDHCARVLVVEDVIYRGDLSPAKSSSEEDLQSALNQVSISWIDQDAERPAVDPRQTLLDRVSYNWRPYTELVPIFAEWLTGQSKGPMSTAILLLPEGSNPWRFKRCTKSRGRLKRIFLSIP